MDQSPNQTEQEKAGEQIPDRQSIPWLWLIFGFVITIVACGFSALLINNTILQPPIEPALQTSPTLIILTAPPSATPAPTSPAPPPTPIPTFTPIPTPDTAVAPEEITPGFYVVVANTDDLGVTVRGGPSTKNVALLVAEEGTTALVLEGPEEADNFQWWHIQLADGTEGWVVANYLAPSAAP